MSTEIIITREHDPAALLDALQETVGRARAVAARADHFAAEIADAADPRQVAAALARERVRRIGALKHAVDDMTGAVADLTLSTLRLQAEVSRAPR